MQAQRPRIHEFLVSNLPRDLLLRIEENLMAGAGSAYFAARGMNEGHLANVVGQMRHFHMNEQFADALSAGDACPSPLKGNGLVVGRVGPLRLGRFNSRIGPWNNARRSTQRRLLAAANLSIEPLVNFGLFDEDENVVVSEATVFFVGVFSGSLAYSPDRPLTIDIAVPDSQLTGWLFKEPVAQFVNRYNATHTQIDNAKPLLKSAVVPTAIDVAKSA